MGLGTLDIREHLMQSNESFRRLAQEHHQYDEQLEKLVHKAHLSEDEKITELKKMKLHVKDQMEMMIQKHRQQAVKSTGPAS